MKKVLVWLIALVMLCGCFSAMAESSSVQIYDKYYTSSGAVVDNVTVSNNSQYDDVVISKTIAGTGVENEFDITLTVKTKEEIVSSSEAPDVAVVLVLDTSSSMSSDSVNAMEAAANSFLDTFASDADGGLRKAAIVTYNRSVFLTKDWDDASTLQCPTNLTTSGGTNTHGGLLRAQYLLQQSSYDGVPASDFEYRYVVLMTDGDPTSYLTDSAISSGSWTGVDRTTSSACETKAEATANTIKAMGNVELYAIGYDLTANGSNENWLKNNVASTTSHYFRANISGLQSQFEAIANAMKISASAWVVTDPMADGVTLLNTDGSSAITVTDGTLEWNLRGVTPTASTVGNVTTYTYTTTYRVKLDTLAAGFSEDNWYRTNGNTSLTYWIEQDGQYLNNNHQVISSPTLDNAIMTMYFNVPAVEGYKGDLSFIKVDDAGNPISGVSFTATVKGGSWSKTAESNDNGVVSMTGLPSGHTYVLTETTPAGYLENEAIEFAVSYGQVDYSNFEMNDAGQPIVVNTRETGDAFITVTKVFEGVDEADLPASLDVTAVNQDNAALSYSATLYQADGYTADITVLAPGTYIVTENVPTIDGYNLESTTYTTPNTDNTASIVTVAIDGTAAVTVTNTYNKQEANLTLSKTFEGDALTDEQKADISFTVSGPDGYSKTVAYTEFANGSYTLSGLALGTYTVTETATVAGYEVETVYTVNGQTTSSVTLADGDNAAMAVTNTYDKQEGGLMLTKSFTGDLLTEEQKAGITFTVTGPDGYSKTIAYSEFTNGQYNLGNLPLGAYTIVESNADVDGYIRTTSHTTDVQAMTSLMRLANPANYTINVELTDDNAHTIAITNDYNKQEADLTITKTFEGDALTDEQKAGISFTISGPDGYSKTVAYTEFANGSYTLSGLALGTYTVTETATVAGYEVETVYTVNGQATSSITLADGDNAAMAVTNTYDKQEGGLMLTKSFTGDLLTEEQKAGITFTVTGPDGYSKTIAYSEFTNGQYNLGNLPLGAYTIVESNADVDGYIRTTSHTTDIQPMVRLMLANDAAATDYTINISITDDNAHTIAITNDYNKQEANLTLSKTFEGDALTDEQKAGISFTVSGPDGYSKTVAYTEFANGSYTLSGLALGTYTVTETATVAGYEVETVYTVNGQTTSTVTLADGDNAAMAVTNTYDKQEGGLMLTKSFTGDLLTEEQKAGITFTVTGPDGYSKTIAYSEFTNGQYSLGNVPLGAYTIVESNADVDGYIRTTSHTTDIQPMVRLMLANDAAATDYTINISITDDNAHTIAITNDYNKQEADLTITKTFAGELDEVTDAYKNAITFTVTGPEGFEQTVTYADFENGSYTFTGLALGTYTVAEGNTALSHYNVETTGADSVTLADGDAAQMAITNTYAAQPGNLKVTKAFGADSALTASDFASGIGVTVTAVEGGQTYTATLSSANGWTHTFTGLVPGEYTVSETSTHDANYYTLSATFTGLTNGTATVLPGETRATDVTITNTYTLGQASVLGIPFEKLVSLGKGGNVPPMGETTFYFNLNLQLAQPMMLRSADTVQPGEFEVEYHGALQPSDIPAYDFKVTVNGPNIGEGWIVIRGNAYDLQRLTVTITESEFGMMKRWEYEAGPDYAWTVAAQQQADGTFEPVMTDAEGNTAKVVHFDNYYTQVADIPATGDDSDPALWIMLMALSAAAFLMLQRKTRRQF